MGEARAETLRIATFHTELDRDGPGLLLRDILSGKDAQVEAVLAVTQAADADVLVLAGVDYDLGGVTLAALADRLPGYPYWFAGAPNRGRPSGTDLDGDGRLGGPDDAIGYASFQGQGGLAVLSRLPLDIGGLRDFTLMPWHELPGQIAPPGASEALPLSTTAHWDLPIRLAGGAAVHLLIWHATPPVFDGPDDRNGRRNHDETAFWLRYLDGALGARPPRHFVLAGVANMDPVDGDGRPEALQALLSDPRVSDPRPLSAGGVAAAADGGVNRSHLGDPAMDTADWEDKPGWPGNLRVDYVLPSANLTVVGSGVIWPASEGSLRGDVERASRHRLVWVDIEVPDSLSQSD